jgi:multidrug resistance efflux pump
LKLAKKGHSQSVTKVDGTRRLYEKGFLSASEREMDEYLLQSDQLKVTTAEIALDLFLKYEFLKSSEEFLGKYVEAVNELGRARKAAVSKLAQAEAKAKAAQGRFNLETRQREEILDLIEKCTIRAKKPGLVVYGGSGSRNYYYNSEQIREGALVREQQPIITIPDLTRMAVKVKIHETYVKIIHKGQKVRITADAFPDKTLEGQVSKVGVLPDSQNRWMDPDNKVYLTTITIDNVTDWLKPGMSAKTEILVKKLPAVVYVPIQAVTPINGKPISFRRTGDRPAEARGRDRRIQR